MEIWLILLLLLATLCLCATLKALLDFFSHNTNPRCPPGPWTVPIIGNFLWLRESLLDLEPILSKLHTKYGPIITVPIGSQPNIFINSPSIAHQALIQNGAIFADRPQTLNQSATSKLQRAISSSPYGPYWRLLRRNLTSEILHPSRLKSYRNTRKWALHTLISKLKDQSESGKSICVTTHLRLSIFSLVFSMCFGQNFDEEIIKKAEASQRTFSANFTRFRILTYIPNLGKIIFKNLQKELLDLSHHRANVLTSLIRTQQIERKEENHHDTDDQLVVSYIDTLFKIWLPDEGRKLNEFELRTLCSEFLNAGTDATSTAMEWIMANLVKYQDIQAKLYSEIKKVLGEEDEEITEEDLQKMPYLKAVILEGLRRHPPFHFGMSHSVTEEFHLNSLVIPKNAVVYFNIAEMGWDPNVWENPMEFCPDRFLSGEGFDITGGKEIKMLPFGVGRRICPGYNLALLLIEYFVVNLIKDFKWMAVEGEDVDLSPMQNFEVVMKTPLKAHISPRVK
ncbi:cytochrome P450 89A2-like [Telopea speciosissima]|uniref:cytochrome P450 89A2-like n=1 Tax=Telopea speciosissima TaxID=54955 RepID=UPI001CC50B3F|nr:cytochrome P450 89A2-like [Telopea speciosissima]